MKPWALALAGSLALHLAVAVSFRSQEPVVVRPEPGPKRDDGFVSFTPVSVAEPAKAAAAPTAVRAVKVSAPVGSTAPDFAAPVRVDEGGGESPVVVSGAAEVGPEPVGVPSLPEAAPAAAGRGDPSAEVIALVHARLAAVADRCYPAAARRFQQRGTVQLSFCTDDQGATSSTSVTQSSGAELLDAAARGCVLESAAPFPREASAHCFSVPVRFGLAR